MLQSPCNTLLLKIGDVFVKHFGPVAKTSALYGQTSDINPADMVNIVGEIAALPKVIMEDAPGYKGFSTRDMRVGDTAIFRYDVIHSYSSDNTRFKNMFWYRGKEYWAADIQKIFAIIMHGEIVMVNGYCMLEEYNNPMNIIIPHTMKNIDGIGSAVLTHIGNNLTHLPNIEARPGDTVFFNPHKIQKYEIGKKKFAIIRQQQIFGVASNLSEDLSWKR